MRVNLRCGLLAAAIAVTACEKKEPAGAASDAPVTASEATALAAGGPAAPVASGGPAADRAAEAALGAAERAAALADRAGAAATAAGQQASEAASQAGAVATAAGQRAAALADRAGAAATAAGQQAAEAASQAGAVATAAGQQASEAASQAADRVRAAGAASAEGAARAADQALAASRASGAASAVLPADFPLPVPTEASGHYSQQIDGNRRVRSGVFTYAGAPGPAADRLERAMSDRGLTPTRSATAAGQTRVTSLRAKKGDVEAAAVVTTTGPGATQIVVSWTDPAP